MKILDKAFTKSLQDWLNSEVKDCAQGALFLLQLTGNSILYGNLMVNPSKNEDYITYHIQKHLNARLTSFTHEEVQVLEEKANQIINSKSSLINSNPANDFQKGKRQDHDLLPNEIQALYVENFSIVQRMRAVHAQLSILSNDGSTCPDSDRYPFLKELIELDKKLHKNWEIYDHYSNTPGEQIMNVDARSESKKYLRLINLNKNKYAKNPSEEYKIRIAEWYTHIVNPAESLTKELSDLGIL